MRVHGLADPALAATDWSLWAGRAGAAPECYQVVPECTAHLSQPSWAQREGGGCSTWKLPTGGPFIRVSPSSRF